MTVFTIGQLADAAGVNVETIRYYERRGLLAVPPRSAAGYRQYGDADLWRLDFVRRAKSLGFTLTEIASLVDAEGGDESEGSVERVLSTASARLAAVDAELTALGETRARLAALLEVCLGGDAQGCVRLDGASLKGASLDGGLTPYRGTGRTVRA